MADLLIYYGNVERANLLVSEDDRGGGLLAQAVGSKTGIPVTLANWHAVPPDVQGVVTVQADVGFSGRGSIMVNGIQSEQRVILVDDLLSSGGTAGALIKAIRKVGAHIEDAFFVGEKVNIGGREKLNRQFPDVRVTSLVKFISEIENRVTIDADSYNKFMLHKFLTNIHPSYTN